MNTIYLSIGSNLKNRFTFLKKSINLIEKKISKIYLISKIYESDSWGYKSNKYLNLCVCIKSKLEPRKILKAINLIEKSLGGNERNYKGNDQYGDRTIDIDILFYGNKIINERSLKIPHPKIEKRRFVLKPLNDIAPNFKHPITKTKVFNLLNNCSDNLPVIYYKKKIFKEKFKFIAIEGNIGSGKTSLSNMLSKEINYKKLLEDFFKNKYLKKFYENKSKYALDLELSFSKQRFKIFNKINLNYYQENFISDYSIYKSLIFSRINLDSKKLKSFELDFEKKNLSIIKPDLIIYLDQKIENLIMNIKKRNRDFEKSISKEYLYGIKKSYQNFLDNNSDINIIKIDNSELDFVNNKDDFKKILDTIYPYI